MVPKTLTDLFITDGKKELIRGIQSGKEAFHGPWTVTIDVTNSCNLACLYCWMRSPLLKEKQANEQWRSYELPLGLIKRLIDDLCTLKTRNINIAGGGEPFMHPDIMEILAYIKEKGLHCKINTNFTLVSENIAQRIVDLGIDVLVVNLWAGTAKTYEQLHHGAEKVTFARVIKTLKLMSSLKQKNKKASPSIIIHNVISKINYHEIEQMLDLASDAQVGCFFEVLDPVYGYTDHMLLSDSERQELKVKFSLLLPKIEELVAKRAIDVVRLNEFLRRISSKNASSGLYDEQETAKMPCYAGWVYSRITAAGNVDFCLKTYEYHLGNIYQHSFKEIWNSAQYQEVRARRLQRLSVPGQTLRCEKVCDNRQDNAYAHALMKKYSLLKSLSAAFRNNKR